MCRRRPGRGAGHGDMDGVGQGVGEIIQGQGAVVGDDRMGAGAQPGDEQVLDGGAREMGQAIDAGRHPLETSPARVWWCSSGAERPAARAWALVK